MTPGQPNTLYQRANLIKQKYTTLETVTQNMKNKLKSSTENEKRELKRKPTHGHFYRGLGKQSVDKEKPQVWLCCSCLKGEMESLITAYQGRALNTRYHQRNNIK
jgi:hypothetical protein